MTLEQPTYRTLGLPDMHNIKVTNIKMGVTTLWSKLNLENFQSVRFNARISNEIPLCFASFRP
jgi:hypothetical protein